VPLLRHGVAHHGFGRELVERGLEQSDQRHARHAFPKQANAGDVGIVARDVDRARELLTRDDGIDQHYGRIFKDVLELMARDPKSVYRATRVQSIAKYLERIADHAMNVAETVVFLVKGTDIRHYNRKYDSDVPPPADSKPGQR
jgi:Na+/phosphate symporter